MKCRELMVNDWVANQYGTPIQIYSTGDNGAYANTGDTLWIFEDNEYKPHPIPITPEILEKNEEVKSLTMFRKNEQGTDCLALIYITVINLYYVHELQHALRLCGLNELADNFKV